MCWITLSRTERVVEQDPPGAPRYEVALRVVAAGGIEPEIFVMERSTDAFSHVALVPDMTQWPIGRDAALQAGKDYYRVRDITQTWDTRELAAAFAAHAAMRVSTLNTLWGSSAAAPFGGESVVTYNSEDT